MLGICHIKTIAYHKIERCHQALKTLKAQLTNNCMQQLPLVMLELCSHLIGEYNTTPAKLVYGTNIRLPADFLLQPQDPPTSDVPAFVTKLREKMSALRQLCRNIIQNLRYLYKGLAHLYSCVY